MDEHNMTDQEREKLEEELYRKFAYERKLETDEMTIRSYEMRLRAARKSYSKAAQAISQGGRKNRALSLGECCLKAIEELEKINGEHQLLQGTLTWQIMEEPKKDENGKRVYQHIVVFHVKADEPALEDGEIEAEVAETRRRIEQETREMFAEDPPWEDAEVETPVQ